MSPEEIRNQCEDDADRAPSDLTVWRDRGLIIAALIAENERLKDARDGWMATLEEMEARTEAAESKVAAIHALAADWEWGGLPRPLVERTVAELREALS